MAEEFGQVYSGVLFRDHWITSLGATAADAIERGEKPQTVWVALCEEMQIPVERRHGRGHKDPDSAAS